VILEFPSVPADGTHVSFSLELELSSLAAVNVKPMFAGKVEVNGNTLDDGNGGTCSCDVLVGVPHDQGRGSAPVDDGLLYDSTGS
jgi:hypothetical protein